MKTLWLSAAAGSSEQKLVNKLRQHGHEVVAASPSSGVNTLTGEGLAEALAGAQVVQPRARWTAEQKVLQLYRCLRCCGVVRTECSSTPSDRSEPAHVHVEREDKRAKFWLKPVRLEDSVGFRRVELGKLQALVEGNVENLLRSWNEFFGN